MVLICIEIWVCEVIYCLCLICVLSMMWECLVDLLWICVSNWSIWILFDCVVFFVDLSCFSVWWSLSNFVMLVFGCLDSFKVVLCSSCYCVVNWFWLDVDQVVCFILICFLRCTSCWNLLVVCWWLWVCLSVVVVWLNDLEFLGDLINCFVVVMVDWNFIMWVCLVLCFCLRCLVRFWKWLDDNVFVLFCLSLVTNCLVCAIVL